MHPRAARVPRFHVDGEPGSGDSLELPEEAARHAQQVLRLRPGDRVTLFNGRGGEYVAVIEHADRRCVRVRIERFDAADRESPLEVTLVQGISASDRMDFTIQKAVELGVAAIRPLLTQRAVVRLSEERAASRQAHWQRIAIASCEQCGRNVVPAVHPPLTVAAYCAQTVAQSVEKELRLLLVPGAPRRLRELEAGPTARIALAVGPEAGFSADEQEQLIAAGCLPTGLGPRVLRTETAGPAALAALNALFGDL